MYSNGGALVEYHLIFVGRFVGVFVVLAQHIDFLTLLIFSI